jgi:hypothetical protein
MVNLSKRLVYDLPVQEQQRVEGLILGRGRRLTVHGQVAQKQFYFRFRGLQLIPGSHFVELDEAPNPVAVSGFGSDGVVLKPEDLRTWSSSLSLGLGVIKSLRRKVEGSEAGFRNRSFSA